MERPPAGRRLLERRRVRQRRELGRRPDALQFFDSVDPIGRTYWKKYEAYDKDFKPIATNDAVTWFKYASWSAVSATCSGSKVTVNARASRYWAGGNKYIPYTKKYAVLQWKTHRHAVHLGARVRGLPSLSAALHK